MKNNFKEWFEATSYFDFDFPTMCVSEETQNIGSMDDPTKDAVYNHYYQTYKAAGMNPWSRHDFDWRANQWLAAGKLPKIGPDGQEVNPNMVGFVTAKDNNGIIKLTGMDGPNTRAKIAGMMEIVATGKPIWGAMAKEFTEKLKKAGFSNPPHAAMKLLMPIISSDNQFYSGGSWGDLNADGGINFNLIGTGNTVKYFTANKPFYRILLQKHKDKMGLTDKLLNMVKNWNTLPQMMKTMAMPMAQAKGFDEETISWLSDVLNDSPAPAPKPEVPKPMTPTAPSGGTGLDQSV